MKHKCVALVTDNRKQDAGAILAFIHELARLVKGTLPRVKTIHYPLDSRSSQYQNITIFSILYKNHHILRLNATWCYFEAGHSKGQCDVVGAAAKRMANTVKRRGLIRNATDFVAKGNAAPGEVLYVNVTPQEINLSPTPRRLQSPSLRRPLSLSPSRLQSPSLRRLQSPSLRRPLSPSLRKPQSPSPRRPLIMRPRRPLSLRPRRISSPRIMCTTGTGQVTSLLPC